MAASSGPHPADAPCSRLEPSAPPCSAPLQRDPPRGSNPRAHSPSAHACRGRPQLRLVAARRPSARVCVQRACAQVDNHRTNVDFGHCSNSTSRLIASTDACFELASIGGPPAPRPGARPGLPRRARAAADMLPVCHFDAQVRPCLCAAGLTGMLRLRAATRRSTRRFWRTSCRFVSYLSMVAHPTRDPGCQVPPQGE